jgi:hypothetical protein
MEQTSAGALSQRSAAELEALWAQAKQQEAVGAE